MFNGYSLIQSKKNKQVQKRNKQVIKLEMFIINCKLNLMLPWSADRLVCEADKATNFATTNLCCSRRSDN